LPWRNVEKFRPLAKQLHLSQPAVTAHIRRLEKVVGKPLVTGRRVALD
jgi:DNA-binding transcriptional LysR family regulator